MDANLAGEVAAPKVLILPSKTTGVGSAGELKLSGANLYFHTGTKWERLSGANAS